MNVYRYMFFRIYEWGRRTHGISDLPEYNAILGLSILATISIFNAFMVTDLFFDQSFVTDHAKPIAVSIGFLSLVMHYAFLIHGGRLQQITEEFHDNAPARSGMTVIWTYPACTLFLYFLLLVIRR